MKALDAAVREVTGEEPVVRQFNGGWVDAAELMRTGERRLRPAGGDHVRPRGLRARPQVDEHIAIAEVAEAAEIYARATAELLRMRSVGTSSVTLNREIGLSEEIYTGPVQR